MFPYLGLSLLNAHQQNLQTMICDSVDEMQQVWNLEDAEDEVLAMVVSTGLNTCMGSMVRQLIAPTRLHLEASPFVEVMVLFTP